MPWRIEKRDDKYCVIKETDDSVEKCHDTRAKALAHQKALYAAEAKSKTMDEKTEQTEQAEQTKEQSVEKGYVPYGVSTFEELDGYRQSREMAEQVFNTTDDLIGLISSTVENPDVPQKGAHIVRLAQEYAQRVDQAVDSVAKDVNVHTDEQSFFEKLTDVVKSAIKSLINVKADDDDDVIEQNNKSFMLWKDKNDRLRWFARYSNNFRDDDNPAEIIASKSHHRFVELVDSGQANMPVLELWHVPQWKFGVADWVAYDDTGFALASGTIDEGCEDLAKFVAKQKRIAMSHGMPMSSIKRDLNDSTTIVEHITEEISPLPAFAAANKYTGWELIGEQSKSKEDDMAIPAKKLNTLVDEWKLNPDMLKALEERNSEDAKAAKEEGRESKEKTTKDADEEKTAQAEQTEQVEEQTEEAEQVEAEAETEQVVVTTAATSEALTREEIASAFAPLFVEMSEQISVLTGQVEEMAKEIKSLKESDEVKIATKAQETPAASIASLLGAQMRAVGSEAAQVDGREKLAKAKPKEYEADDESGPFPVPFLNQIVKT